MPPNPCFQPVQKNLVAWLLIGRLIRSYGRLCKADELVPVVTEEQKKALLWGWDFQEIRLMLLNVVDVWRFKQLTTQHLRLQVGLTMNEEGTDWSSTSGFSRWFCKKADLNIGGLPAGISECKVRLFWTPSTLLQSRIWSGGSSLSLRVIPVATECIHNPDILSHFTA